MLDFSYAFLGDGSVFAVIFEVTCTPDSERKVPESFDCSAEPLVGGEGGARAAVMIVGGNGLSPVKGNSPAEKLIPADSAL